MNDHLTEMLIPWTDMAIADFDLERDIDVNINFYSYVLPMLLLSFKDQTKKKEGNVYFVI